MRRQDTAQSSDYICYHAEWVSADAKKFSEARDKFSRTWISFAKAPNASRSHMGDKHRTSRGRRAHAATSHDNKYEAIYTRSIDSYDAQSGVSVGRVCG
jgi:hypothetical protein